MADGSVKPAQAASAPLYPARDSPTAMPTWLLARPWQELTKRDQVSIAPFGEPAPPCDKFGAEVAQVRNGAAKRCQSKPQKNKKDRPWSAVIGRVIRHTFAFMICNELINNKRNSITKFDINLEKNTSMCTTQF